MTELSIVERAQKALSIEHTETELKELAAKYADVQEIKDDTDYELVKRGGIELKTVRVSIEKAGKSARDDANKFSKAVIAEERRLTGIITPEEDRLKALRKAVDDEEARKAEELRQAEIARIQRHTDTLNGIDAFAMVLPQDDSASIQCRIDSVIGVDPGLCEEYKSAAEEKKNSALESLSRSLKERQAFEAQKAENDRIAAEQAAEREKIEQERAEAARVMKEAQEKAQAVEAEKRAEEEKKLAAERAEAEKIRLEKERLEREAAEREQKEAEAKAAEEEKARQEAMRPDKEKLRQWAAELRFVEGPDVKDKQLQKLRNEAMRQINDIGTKLIAAIEAL